ncbi:MAG: hypothetical protein LBD05_02415 [Mycoplasmataceae bacterium]|jgi:hypothetical protein|nr:hypothetical protein [Mycoplasmataceae bacterium]
MTKVNIEFKQNNFGGIAPMALWIGITGTCMLASTVGNLINSFTSKNTYNATNGVANNMQVTHQNSAYTRISPYPSRSSILLGI